jgi:hypothetical protein
MAKNIYNTELKTEQVLADVDSVLSKVNSCKEHTKSLIQKSEVNCGDASGKYQTDKQDKEKCVTSNIAVNQALDSITKTANGLIEKRNGLLETGLDAETLKHRKIKALESANELNMACRNYYNNIDNLIKTIPNPPWYRRVMRYFGGHQNCCMEQEEVIPVWLCIAIMTVLILLIIYYFAKETIDKRVSAYFVV